MDLYFEGEDKSSITSIVDIVQPIQDGDAAINSTVVPIPSQKNNFFVDVIPGHPRLSMIEDRLSLSWSDTIGGDIGGLRKSNWVFLLLETIKDRYDFCFIDLGPSLGSINRSVLLGVEYFLTPMGCDIFSIIGIRNIAHWLARWIDEYIGGVASCNKRHPGKIAEFKLQEELKISQGFIGYTLQQYITKSKEGIKRPTKAFEAILQQVPREIESSFKGLYAHGLTTESLKLGDIPQLYSLIPLSQISNVPIFDMSASNGLVGSQFKQKKDYTALLKQISESIINNIEQG